MSVQDYWDQLSILSGASVGIIISRTREPYRCHMALRDYTAATNKELKAKNREPFDYKLWTATNGWGTFDLDQPAKPPKTDGNVEATDALACIHGKGGSNNFGQGIYAMMFPHYFFTNNGAINNPTFGQRLLEYSRDFTDVNNKKRLVLIVPPTFEVPPEVQDVVAMLDFDTPTRDELMPVVTETINALPAERRPKYTAADIDRVIALGAGMTAMEFENAIARGFVSGRSKLPNLPIDELCDMLAIVKTDVIKRSDVLELMKPVNMDEVGGLEVLKDWIRDIGPALTKEAREAGVDAPKGCALIGPPGTGKSLIAKAISTVLGIPLIRFDVSKVFGSLVGQSEARVRMAAKLVESMAPCVCFVDEADKAFDQGSGGGDSGVGQRVLGSILTWMNDSDSGVFFAFSANRTAGMPAELLRKGRLDEVWAITTPNEDERRAILSIHLKKRKEDIATIKDIDVAIEASHGYVGAELEAAVKEAKRMAFISQTPITGAAIAEHLRVMKPLSEAFKEDFQRMETWAENNARAASAGTAKKLAAARNRTRTAPAGGAAGANPRRVIDG